MNVPKSITPEKIMCKGQFSNRKYIDFYICKSILKNMLQLSHNKKKIKVTPHCIDENF